jgi:DNA-binding NarL/FixJ family response regulator
MGCQVVTLLDVLSSRQFQIVILLALGLDTCQIADLLEATEPTVCHFVCDSLDLTGCRDPEGLAARLIFECENRLYDERLITELAVLQGAAKRMLKRMASTNIS